MQIDERGFFHLSINVNIGKKLHNALFTHALLCLFYFRTGNLKFIIH